MMIYPAEQMQTREIYCSDAVHREHIKNEGILRTLAQIQQAYRHHTLYLSS